MFFCSISSVWEKKAIFNYRSHKKMKEWLQIQEKDYGNKKSRNFRKLLPCLSKRLRGGYYLPP